MSKIICQKCGQEISNEFGVTLAYCTSCGAGIQSMSTEKPAAFGEIPTIVSPKPKSKMTRNILGCLGLFLLPVIGILGYLVWFGNPVQKYVYLSNCPLANEPSPKTSEDYFKRAQKHIDIFSEGHAASLDDCAFDALNEALRLDPNNVDALRVRGYGYKQRKQYDLALADFSKAIEIVPTDDRNYYFRSIVYFEKTLFENSLADISEAIRLKPNDDGYYQKRGDVYLKLGKTDLAAADKLKALELMQAKNGKTPTPVPNKNPVNPDSSGIISGGILNTKATNLVQPPYPPAARAVRAGGAVNVQVTIDESGNVISAAAVSGHALLKRAAETAALASKFNPTIVNGKPMKVVGVIVYNFVQ